MDIKFLKENWFLFVFGAAVFAGYVEYRVRDTVAVEVHAIDAVDSNTIGMLRKDIEVLAKDIGANKAQNDKVEAKLDKIIDILLED